VNDADLAGWLFRVRSLDCFSGVFAASFESADQGVPVDTKRGIVPGNDLRGRFSRDALCEDAG
jgi:hypothetical protein